MKTSIKICSFLVALVLLAGIAACKQKPSAEGPAEQVGKQIDQGMEKAGQEVGNALESAGQAMKEAGQDVKKESKN